MQPNMPPQQQQSVTAPGTMSPEEILRGACAVCFDVDSTVITEEGIDTLAAECGVGEEVAEWTKKAMGGNVLFEDALRARLDIMKPSLDHVRPLQQRPALLTPGIKEFVDLLRAKGKHVYLVSGGFRQMIYPVADELGIPHSNVYANNLLFDENTGDYRGFDENEPTSRSGGKRHVIELIQRREGYKSVVMIGDGVTDMEARPPAALFIGFGGNVERQAVKEGADWFVSDFGTLSAAL